MPRKPVFLCISCYFKGADFLRACKEAGNIVYLVTDKNLELEDWPHHSIDDIFYMEQMPDGQWNNQDLIDGLAFFMRTHPIDRIIALDDFDVERAALLREHLRMPGMGQTTSRHFRDKLAMRLKAEEGGINVPAFSALFHDDDVHRFTENNPAPWVVKPRSEASATGIQKVNSVEELWTALDSLGNKRHHCLIESFVPGDVYHVDSVCYKGKNVFSRCSRYLDTPFEVAHEGGIFRTMTLASKSKDHKALIKLNQKLMNVFGMQDSATHSEYIKDRQTGEFHFLETSSRVGGAHIAELVEAASGVNLWHEWARLESKVLRKEKYAPPKENEKPAGLIISLSRYKHPDQTPFQDEEIFWRMKKDHHVGFVFKSDKEQTIKTLLDKYAERIAKDYHASEPAPDHSTH